MTLGSMEAELAQGEQAALRGPVQDHVWAWGHNGLGKYDTGITLSSLPGPAA